MNDELPNEDRVVVDLIYGRDEFSRSTAPEPSLLPHMAAKLCHDFSLPGILTAAHTFGVVGGQVPPWPPLLEATLRGISGRPELVAYLRDFTDFDPGHLRVLEAIAAADADTASGLAQAGTEIGADYPQSAGLARLLPVLDADRARQYIGAQFTDPTQLDAESVRSILEACRICGVELPGAWIDDAMAVPWGSEYRFSRRAHLLPYLPFPMRGEWAGRLAAPVADMRLPADARALAVSRVAPFVTDSTAWDRSLLLDDLEPVWQEKIDELLAAAAPEEPWGDVFRVHPAATTIARVARPHEGTAGSPEAVSERWGSGPMEAVGGEDPAPPPSRGNQRTASVPTLSPDGDAAPGSAPRSAASPAPPEPRRLQADVLHLDTTQEVTAFVAGARHLVDVSIGRGARVRADVDFGEDVFDETDGNWLQLPVWFRVNGATQTDVLRVPRDRSRNSSTASFEFDAPAAGRVIAQIHVMRPGGGLLLQSALLVGDVVADAAAAVSHEPDITLTVNVVAADLENPVESGEGRSLIADTDEALAENAGAVIDIDVSQLQEALAASVRKIETAADRREFDVNATARALEDLAMAGQATRAVFARDLGELASAPVLQIVSLREGDLLPLELFYDGPALTPDSAICPTWQRALKSGSCADCAGGGPVADESPARVCPMRFWSMHKVIERRTADTRGGKFRVGSERNSERARLRPIREVVVAASGRVESQVVDALGVHAQTCLAVDTERANDWPQWVDVIRRRQPELLLAMPHNQPNAGGLASALMIGEPREEDAPFVPGTALMAGAVREKHVRQGSPMPGPLALLLGCNTQFEPGMLSTFASEFRDHGAALTVATIGKLRADHAPLAATAILDELASPRSDDETMGDVLLRVRRALLADGMIMALLLVGNGDAAWLLPEPRTGT